MKYLIPLILLFPSLAFAVDDAVISEIDVKASSANAKADNNNSRIQALEAEDELIKEKVLLNKTLKADKEFVGVELLKKAEKTVVDEKLLLKANELEVVERLVLKADKTEVNDNRGHIGALEAENIVLHQRIDTVESLPVGATPGDIQYWDGSVWQLTPAPPVDAATPLTLTSIDGVPTWTEAEAGVVYAIGDTGPAGGMVIYITNDGLHGLEAAPDDVISAEWGCYGMEVGGAVDPSGGTAGYYGDGRLKTDIIISTCGAGTAAYNAASYNFNGYFDWHLPGFFASAAMCHNSQQVGLTWFEPYATATHFQYEDDAFTNELSYGIQYDSDAAYCKGVWLPRNEVARVRPVRSF